jgi:hypothetical protein
MNNDLIAEDDAVMQRFARYCGLKHPYREHIQ